MKELKIRTSELNNTIKEIEWIDLVWPHKIRKDTGYMKPNFNKFIYMVLFFLNSDGVFKTKLNKLLFYADFHHYKLYSQGISGSRYRAIEFGPVPSEYDALYNWLFKKNVINIIESLERWGVTENFQRKKEFDEKIFDEKEINTLRTIHDKFKNFSATELKDYSHKEKAWIENKDSRKIIDYQKYAFEICI
ncbi:MAG: SocA family protein [Ignavibacteria bacterium]|nr:SocA family protein [Ignavibacteria bacterium]